MCVVMGEGGYRRAVGGINGRRGKLLMAIVPLFFYSNSLNIEPQRGEGEIEVGRGRGSGSGEGSCDLQWPVDM